MYAQVITAKVTDRDAFERQKDRWRDEVRPGAIGFLGSTGGIAADGTFFIVARFESAEAAAANGARPEQSAWWEETAASLADVDFGESTDVTLRMGGGRDDAGFVQVMCGHVTDAAAYAASLEREADFERAIKEHRPDVLGGLTVRLPDDRYYDVIYFESEAIARENESKPMPEDWQAEMGQMMAAAPVDRFIDLPEPFFN